MTNIMGIKKDLLLMKMLKQKEVRSLPKSFLMYLRSALKYEKFVELNGQYVLNTQMPVYPSAAFTQFLNVGKKVHEGKTAPSSCHIVATRRCDYNCWHCSDANREETEDLPKDLLLDTIQRLQDMGNSLIGITGGEPLKRDDLEEIIGGIGERSTIMLFTTGHGLTPQRAKRLVDAGVFYAVVSLDHFRPEEHDRLRGFEGSHKIALDAIKMFKEAGAFTVVSSVPTREMLDSGDIWEFMEFIKGLGVHEVRVLAPIPTGRIVGQRDLRWSKSQAQSMWEVHKKYNADKDAPRVTVFAFIEGEGILGCCAGTFHMFIEGDGTVTPCDMIPLNFGNIKTCGIEKAYNRMADVYKIPRHDCFLRAAVTLIGRGFEEEGRLPLSRERSMDIANKIRNIKMSECFQQLKMPYPWGEEDKVKAETIGTFSCGGCAGDFMEDLKKED